MYKLKTLQKPKSSAAESPSILWDVLAGRDGKPGVDGCNGMNGKDGRNGLDGRPGQQGEAGPRGPRGPQGEQGQKGTRGEPGKDGQDGKDGRGIVRMQIKKMDLIVTYTDGENENVGRVVGEKGNKGERGLSGILSGGSGTSTRQGFIDYNDASTSSTPVIVSADVWTTIPNDGLGSFTNKNYRPQGVGELMDTNTGSIDPRELSLGDVIIIRNDFTVIPQTNNASLKFRYTLGGGAGSYTLEKRLGRLDEGSGIDYRFSLATDKIYMGDTNTRDNLIGLEVKMSTPGTLVNAGSVISVLKYEV